MKKTKKYKLEEEQNIARRHSTLKILATVSVGASVGSVAFAIKKVTNWIDKEYEYKRYVEVVGQPAKGSEAYFKMVPSWTSGDTLYSAFFIVVAVVFAFISYYFQRLAFRYFRPS